MDLGLFWGEYGIVFLICDWPGGISSAPVMKYILKMIYEHENNENIYPVNENNILLSLAELRTGLEVLWKD